jgi:hypothetical protein
MQHRRALGIAHNFFARSESPSTVHRFERAACEAVRLPSTHDCPSAMPHGSLLANAGRCSRGRGSAAHRAIRLLDGSDFPSRRVRAPHSSFLHDTRTRRSVPVIAFSLRTTRAPYCGSTTCWVQIGRIGQPRIYAWRDSAALWHAGRQSRGVSCRRATVQGSGVMSSRERRLAVVWPPLRRRHRQWRSQPDAVSLHGPGR